MNNKLLEMATLFTMLSSFPGSEKYYDTSRIRTTYKEEDNYEVHYIVKTKNGYLSTFEKEQPVFSKDKQQALVFTSFDIAQDFKIRLNANKIIKVALNEFKKPRIYE